MKNKVFFNFQLSGLLRYARNRRQAERNRACSNCRSAKEEDKVNDGMRQFEMHPETPSRHCEELARR